MSNYLISVIIPTRNRQTYCAAAVKQILSLKQNIQIIIQDNSDNNDLKELLKNEIDESEVIYNFVNYRIAGIDNYNEASKHATGEFFIAIGDDDALLPNITECALWMKKNNIDGVLPSKRLFYFWPDSNNKDRSKAEGKLRAYNYTGKVKKIDSKKTVIDLLCNGGQDYLSLSMIGSYHCLVRTECMKDVYDITGRYYGGLSPDMYSAIALSLLENKKYVEIDFPISLPGVCPRSTSADSANGKHVGKLETAPHFIGLQEPYIWNEQVPRYYSVETIWAETMLHTLIKMNRKDLIDQYFNRTILINRLFYDNPNYQEDISKILSTEDKELLKDNIEVNRKKHEFENIIKNIYYTFRRLELRNNRCSDIFIASNEIETYLNHRYHKKMWRKIISTSI